MNETCLWINESVNLSCFSFTIKLSFSRCDMLKSKKITFHNERETSINRNGDRNDTNDRIKRQGC